MQFVMLSLIDEKIRWSLHAPIKLSDHRWIPLTKGNELERFFIFFVVSLNKLLKDQSSRMICDAVPLMGHYFNALFQSKHEYTFFCFHSQKSSKLSSVICSWEIHFEWMHIRQEYCSLKDKINHDAKHQDLYSLSCKTSYRQISWSLEAMRLGVIMIVSLWNLTGISAALLPRWLSKFRAIGEV